MTNFIINQILMCLFVIKVIFRKIKNTSVFSIICQKSVPGYIWFFKNRFTLAEIKNSKT